ncbi:MAG: 2-phosphosulfolactate phosphatase [Nitrospira sp. CG24E]|nr:MAG: 2-phosphosulfolactate phosphatase [Nitrospira sp. CG24E]
MHKEKIMKGAVIIDSFPESAARYREGYAIVAIDVIRATTTATTAVSLGRKVYPAQTTDEAFRIASTLKEPLLVGELGGNMPVGFDLTNSPAQMAKRGDVHRPMVLVSSSGTQLMLNAAGAEAVYIACFRNLSAVVRHLAGRHARIAVLGAGTRNQFRREDQMACAWIAERLVESGYVPETEMTSLYISRWSGMSPEAVRSGRSAAYLKQSGQEVDLEYVLSHFDDLDLVPSLINGRLVPAEDRRETRRISVS